MNKVVQIHPKDNLIVALQDLQEGEVINYEGADYTIGTLVKAKHKFVTVDCPAGTELFQFGVLVGETTEEIKKGFPVTTENIVHRSSKYDLSKAGNGADIAWEIPDVSKFEGRTFNGYHREDGTVGTLNNWLVFPLVFCENRNVNAIKKAMEEQLGFAPKDDYSINTQSLIEQYKNGASTEDILNADILNIHERGERNPLFPNVDGLKFIMHDAGCGQSRNDSHALARLLAGYVNNPNVAGATVLSLGCQNTEASIMIDELHKQVEGFNKPIKVFTQQETGKEKNLIAEAVKFTFAGLMEANKIERKPAPLSKLIVGLECGGSDGFSGISGNPTIGHVSDMMAVLGGTSVLAEFPELNGVEQEMINRCTTIENAKKFKDIMDTYSAKAEAVGSGFYANPSPGNIKDGLITDAIKSAGAAKKGGTSPVTDVLDYTEKIKTPGLNLLCTPGNDVESTTGLAGSGCNMILFVTGLGTPTGNVVVPTVKLSTNNALYEKMPDIIDFNCGEIIDGTKTIAEKGEELLEYMIGLASGEYQTKAQLLGQDDFIPWRRGISL